MRAQKVEVGSTWSSNVNGHEYRIISVSPTHVEFSRDNAGKTFTYRWSWDNFYRVMEFVSPSEPAVETLRTMPEIGSVWSTKSGSRRYVVTGVDVDRGNPNDPRWWNVTFHYEGNPQHSYRYAAPKFWSLLKLEPASERWAEVERTLRAYNAAGREAKRLEDAIAAAAEALHDARRAVEAFREVHNQANMDYVSALRKMEDSVK